MTLSDIFIDSVLTPQKSLMTENDRDLNDRTLFGGAKMIMTLNDFDPS